MSILERAQQFLAGRCALGKAKYGWTLDDNPAPVLARLRHLKEELGDGLQYVIWAEDEIERLQRADEALAVAVAALRDIEAHSLVHTYQARAVRAALSRISEIQGVQEKEGVDEGHPRCPNAD